MSYDVVNASDDEAGDAIDPHKAKRSQLSRLQKRKIKLGKQRDVLQELLPQYEKEIITFKDSVWRTLVGAEESSYVVGLP